MCAITSLSMLIKRTRRRQCKRKCSTVTTAMNDTGL